MHKFTDLVVYHYIVPPVYSKYVASWTNTQIQNTWIQIHEYKAGGKCGRGKIHKLVLDWIGICNCHHWIGRIAPFGTHHQKSAQVSHFHQMEGLHFFFWWRWFYFNTNCRLSSWLMRKTSQELRMLSSVTINCQVTKISWIQAPNYQNCNQCLKCYKSPGLSLQLLKL